MHETLIQGFKGYVDTLSFENNCISGKGWLFKEEGNANDITIRLNNGQYQFMIDLDDRKDVAEFYKNNKVNCGWFFNYFGYDPLWLEVMVENEWKKVLEINKNNLNFGINENLEKSFVVVDNFYKDPDSVRNFALTLDFRFHPGYHKGKRTDKTYLFSGLKESFEKILGKKVADFGRYGTNGCFQYCIGGDQLVYHYDTQTYAGMLYLTPDAPPSCGTSFFRSRHNGIRKIDFGKEDHPNTKVTFKNGFLDPTEFEVVDRVGNVYNRLVLFDARMIHAASEYFGSTLENGRLFQLFFFDFEE